MFPVMKALLSLARAIDALNLRVGRAVIWLTLVVVLVSAGNAVIRKVFNVSSNAWLELQWYLFGAMFLLAAGYTLLQNGHVRVDILSARLSRRAQIGIEIFGVACFLLPACLVIMVLSWPMFWDSFVTGEGSSNTGGLLRWPVKLLIPAGFLLLVLAGVSHLIKCVAFLRGLAADPTETHAGKSAEEDLAEAIAHEASLRAAVDQSQRQPDPSR